MSNDFVDIALVEVERPGKSIQELFDVVDISVDTTVNRALVKSMNRRRKGRGYRRGVKEVTGTLTVNKAVSPEFPWETVLDLDEIMQVYYDEAEDGRRFHLEDFIVGDIGTEASEEGESQLKISFLALDHAEVPA